MFLTCSRSHIKPINQQNGLITNYDLKTQDNYSSLSQTHTNSVGKKHNSNTITTASHSHRHVPPPLDTTTPPTFFPTSSHHMGGYNPVRTTPKATQTQQIRRYI